MNSPNRYARRLLALLLAGGATLCAVAWFTTRPPREPEYNGHTLTYWIVALSDNMDSPPGSSKKEQAIAAVRAIGPDGLPTLVRHLVRTDSPIKEKCLDFIGRLHLVKKAFPTAQVWHDRAWTAIILINADQSAAVQALTPLLHDPDPDLRYAALDALPFPGFGETNYPARPMLQTATNDPDQDVRDFARERLSQYDQRAAEKPPDFMEGPGMLPAPRDPPSR